MKKMSKTYEKNEGFGPFGAGYPSLCTSIPESGFHKDCGWQPLREARIRLSRLPGSPLAKETDPQGNLL